MHHRSVNNTVMTYYPEQEARNDTMLPSRMTAPLYDDAVIKEEEKDDSEPDLDRNQKDTMPSELA